MFQSLLRRLTASCGDRHANEARPPRFPRRLSSERLEAREVFSGATVAIAGPGTIDEGAGGAFQVTRQGGVGGHTVAVSYVVEGTARRGADFLLTGSLSFGKNDTTKFIDVRALADDVVEFNESITIRLTKIVVSGNGTGSFSNDQATAFIADRTPPPTVDFAKAEQTVAESVKLLAVTVELRGSTTTRAVTVDYAVTGISPFFNYGTDAAVVGGPTGTITFQPGERRKTLTVEITNDKIAEDLETLQILLRNPQNANLGSFPWLDIDIKDNDDAFAGLESIDPQSAREATLFEGDGGDTVVYFLLRTVYRVERDVTVSYFTADGSAKVADNDYRTKTGQVTLQAGTDPGVVGLTVFVVGDRKKADRSVESFTINLKRDPNVTIVPYRGSVTVNIVNEQTDDQ